MFLPVAYIMPRADALRFSEHHSDTSDVVSSLYWYIVSYTFVYRHLVHPHIYRPIPSKPLTPKGVTNTSGVVFHHDMHPTSVFRLLATSCS